MSFIDLTARKNLEQNQMFIEEDHFFNAEVDEKVPMDSKSATKGAKEYKKRFMSRRL